MENRKNSNLFFKTIESQIEEKFYIGKNFRIQIRPFPISSVCITAEYSGRGTLCLGLKTHLGEAQVNQALEGIKWGPKYSATSYSDRMYWNFDLKNFHDENEVKELFEKYLIDYFN